MSLSAAAQAVVTRVTAKRSGTGDVPHDPDTDRLVLLSEVVAKLDAGAGGGGTSVKLVTVADDTAFGALTSADINVGDFLKFSTSASRPDAVFVNWIYFGPDPTNIYNYAYCVSSVDNEWAIGFLSKSNVSEARVALGAVPVLRDFANDAAMFASTDVVSGDFIRLAASATWGAGAIVQLIDSANTSTAVGYSLVLDGTTAAARSRLGLGTVATENTVPVAKGGTGATTAAAAAAALVNGNPIAPSGITASSLSVTGTTAASMQFNCGSPGNFIIRTATGSAETLTYDTGNAALIFQYAGSNRQYFGPNGVTCPAYGGVKWTSSSSAWNVGPYVGFFWFDTNTLKLTDGGSGYRNLNLQNLCSIGGIIKLASFTVATLPSASTSGAGAQCYVTDSNQMLAVGLGTTVADGGSNKHRVTSDGTNWIVG